MPGTNSIVSATVLPDYVKSTFDKVQRAMLHFPSYAYQPVLLNDQVLIGITSPGSYPKEIVRNPSATILLEGMVYNYGIAELQKQLCALATDTKDLSQTAKSLSRFVYEADGDFLLVLWDQNHRRLFVANDSLGRLPFFYAMCGNKLVLSREPKFIAPFLPSLKFKRASLQAYMMFGFTYGKDTLIEGLLQLAPNTVLSYDCQVGTLSEKTTITYSTEQSYWTKDDEIIDRMKCSFLDSVSSRLQRCKERKQIVSLSGGLDSRGTLAGLLHYRSDVRAVTSNGPEFTYAEAIAKAFGVPLDKIKLEDRTCNAANIDWIRLKDGLDAVTANGRLYGFQEDLVNLYGESTICWTGMYGGELTRYLHLTGGISSVDVLADYLLNAGEEYKYATDKAIRMLGGSLRETREDLLRYLNQFPESSPAGKYVRFRHEFDRKFTGNAEDRYRFFLWTITPYTGLQFIKLITSIDENRKTTKLFKGFLNALDPKTCISPYYSLNLNLNSRARLQALAFFERASRFAMVKKAMLRANKLGKFLRRHHYDVEPMKARAMRQLDAPAIFQDYFDIPTTRRLLEEERNPRGFSRVQTLLSSMNWLSNFRSQFESRRSINQA